MKKFIVFALCAISACSVFAEQFSKAKFVQIQKTKNWEALRKYAYEAQISNESCASQMILSFRHLSSNKLTVEEINKQSQKFKVIGNEPYNIALGVVYAEFNHFEQALKIYNTNKSFQIIQTIVDRLIRNKQYDKAIQLSKQINSNYLILRVYKAKKDWNNYWIVAKTILTQEGGCTDSNFASSTINTMFRYRPKSITKEQQIAFLEQIAQMYPIPGSDFNKWKTFMGFVGYKYKALTGKDLF